MNVNETSQILLGFDLMKAAVLGGHSLSAAWIEALDISKCSAKPLPHVWGGAMACLLGCTHALNQAGMLTAVEVPTEDDYFIHAADYASRLKEVTTATQANDFSRIAYLGALMAACVGARPNCIIFGEKMSIAVEPQ